MGGKGAPTSIDRMTLTYAADASLRTAARDAVLDVVLPVHNEEADLGPCVRRLHKHLSSTFPYPFRITIADNASTDGTLAVARGLADDLAAVRVTHLAAKGRGRALREVWSASDAPVLAYMDVDLSTDLAALLPLVAPLISGHSDVAIGTRLARGGPGRAWAEAGGHLTRVQPAAARNIGGPLLRRPVRLQGHPQGGGRPTAAAGRGLRLVLRHRTAGAGPAGGPADPRGAGRLGR